ncbi:MAG: CBS domain-containing protein [Natronomonas sp.]
MDDEQLVAELMNSPVESVTEDTTLAEAARILTERGIGSLIVGESRLEGIITETDVVAAVGEEIDPATTVGERMSEPVVTVRPTETLQDAANRMGNNGVKKLPVTEDGEPVGIVTTTDLALHLPQYTVNMAHRPEPDIVDGEWE